jgi:hypothetical protein
MGVGALLGDARDAAAHLHIAVGIVRVQDGHATGAHGVMLRALARPFAVFTRNTPFW